jgi:hypothetical protein
MAKQKGRKVALHLYKPDHTTYTSSTPSTNCLSLYIKHHKQRLSYTAQTRTPTYKQYHTKHTRSYINAQITQPAISLTQIKSK